MKVSDIMQKQVDFVTISTSVREVSKLIFGHGINGLPVCKGKKIVGFVTERDILAKFYPSMEEYMEDPVVARDFEGMEKNVSEILSFPVEKIMSRNPITITEDAPLLRAQSTMFVNKVGRLPVVDDKGNLVGILSKGDIFHAIVGGVLPLEKEEGFSDWQARHYDLLTDWEKRLSKEIPDLNRLFKKEEIKKVIDIASSTGEHAIALGEKNFEVVGLESSSLMHEIANKKLIERSQGLKSKVILLHGGYQELAKKLMNDFDGVLFMGNTLPHIIEADKDILKNLSKTLKKKSLMVFQIINFDKIINLQKGLREFAIKDSMLGKGKKHAFVGFYTKKKGKIIIYTQSIFDFDGTKWLFRGINNTTLLKIGQKEITEMLNKIGFSKIAFYGGMFNGSLFSKPFDPLTSDYLNVIAKR
ncbi:CBS domain-containing protein [Candidatus Microgenomates bacterium]|nr:MAG: CBS domain-containing protein [Candidatus Microgenomates bacterium]